MDTVYIFAILVSLIIVSLILLAAQIQGMINGLSRRIERLEQIDEQKPKRLHYDTLAGLEDAIAVALDLTLKQKADQVRTEQLLEILRLLRSDKKYNEYRPAGPRPKGWMD